MSWEYLAGFFDGEGCISVYDYEHKRTFRDRPSQNQPYVMKEKTVRISIDQKIRFFVFLIQKENGVLQEISEFLNEEEIQHSLRNYGKGMQNIAFSSRKAVKKFLSKISPYLRVKKEKANFTLDFLNGISKEVKVY